MKITAIQTAHITTPLKKTFKTALRKVGHLDEVVIKIGTDSGAMGYGAAVPTAVITGETSASIIGAVEGVIAPQLMGMEIENIEAIFYRLDGCMAGNFSAKAGVDIAVHDLFGQLYGTALYKLWGGYRKSLVTDITISVNEPERMAIDSLEAVGRGYDSLKIKVGNDEKKDYQRIQSVRDAVGMKVNLRIDANQGWRPKEAVRILLGIEDAGWNIELVEQPVPARDLEGLKHVTDHVAIPVMADESVFSPADAIRVMQMRAADLVNIKLMKSGGIHNALKIGSMAEVYGVECMMGCMLEGKISVTAAAHLAAAKRIITRIDLDGPALCSEDPVEGGAVFDESKITVAGDAGFGFNRINGAAWNSPVTG